MGTKRIDSFRDVGQLKATRLKESSDLPGEERALFIKGLSLTLSPIVPPPRKRNVLPLLQD